MRYSAGMADATNPPIPAVSLPEVERDHCGRFAPGHVKIGGKRKGILELALEVEHDKRRADLIAVYSALVERALGGDVAAIRTFLDRILGPVSIVVAGDADAPLRVIDRDTAAREMAAILATAAARVDALPEATC